MGGDGSVAWEFVTDDECSTDPLDAVLLVLRSSDAGTATLTGFDDDDDPVKSVSVAVVSVDPVVYAAVVVRHSSGDDEPRVVWARGVPAVEEAEGFRS